MTTQERRSLLTLGCAMAAAIIVWGPPRLTTRTTGLSTALENPQGLGTEVLSRVAGWALVGAVLALFFFRDSIARPARSRLRIRDVVPLRWYGAFGLVALLSTLYSEYRLYTLFFAAQIPFALILLRRYASQVNEDPDRLLGLIWKVHLLQAGAIALLFLLSPNLVGHSLSGSYRLTGGIFGDYGASALVGVLFFLVRLTHLDVFGPRRGKHVLGLGGCIALLLMSQTRSAIALALSFFVIVLMLHPSAKTRFNSLVAAIAGVLLTSTLTIGQLLFSYGSRDLEGISTLTGRTVAFNYLVPIWRERPLFGYGYASGGRSTLRAFVERTGLGIGAPHDILSATLIDVGAVGLFILALTLLASWTLLFKVLRAYYLAVIDVRVRMSPAITACACLLLWRTTSGIVSGGISRVDPVFILTCLSLFLIRARLRRGAATSVEARPVSLQV